MSNETYLFLAFLISWLVLAGYMFNLGRQVQSLNEEVKSIRGDERREG
jgi:CcmD family protein